MHSFYRSSEKITLCLELPGVKPGDLDVSVQDGILTVRSSPVLETGGQSLLAELTGSESTRRYRLDPGLDPEKIEAVLRDGVLVLTVPKRSIRREINVSAA